MKRVGLFLLISLFLPFAVIRCQDDEIDFDDLNDAQQEILDKFYRDARYLRYFCGRRKKFSSKCRDAKRYLTVRQCKEGNKNSCLHLREQLQGMDGVSFVQMQNIANNLERDKFPYYKKRYDWVMRGQQLNNIEPPTINGLMAQELEKQKLENRKELENKVMGE